MGRSQYRIAISGNQPYFVTCTVINWISLFSNVDIAKIVLNSLNFLQTEKRLYLHGYVLLENHVHMIASARDLSKELGNFKSFTARSIIDFLEKKGMKSILDQFEFYKKQHKEGQKHQVWQEGSHPQAILSEKMLVQKLEYIHFNPVRRGYIDDPAHWRYSSYRNYHGQKGILDIQPIGYVD